MSAYDPLSARLIARDILGWLILAALALAVVAILRHAAGGGGPLAEQEYDASIEVNGEAWSEGY